MQTGHSPLSVKIFTLLRYGVTIRIQICLTDRMLAS